MSLRIFAMVMLACALTANGHPIEKVVNLLKKLKDEAIAEGKTEEVAYGKFTYWCSTGLTELDDAIKEEKETVDSLESSIAGLKETKKALEDDIKELDDEITDIQAAAAAAKTKDEKRTKAYVADKKDLKATITAMDSAISAMKGASKTDSALLQAQASVTQALALISEVATDKQQAMLVDFVSGKPDQLAKGDLTQHTKKYSFKSDNVIDLLKELKLKFEDDLTAADVAETAGANGYALEKSARDNAETASKKSRSQKKINLGETETSLSEAEGNLKDEKADLKADSDTLDKTTTACKTAKSEWEERSKIRTGEVEAISEGIKILAKVSGVRTEAPSNPVLPSSPVFFQVSHEGADPKTKAVNLLRDTAKVVHSKALERLALEVSTHLTGPFDKVNDMIQKMVFRLMKEQTDEDKHKAWCDLELDKTAKSKDTKEDKIDDLDASIKSENTAVGKLTIEIKEADTMVADITAYMNEATEIRNAGKKENKISIKEAKQAQTAIANAVSVLEEFYKSSGQVKKEPWEFIQTAKDPVKLPNDPKLWSASYTGVADPKNAETGVLAILETCAADFSKMEAETKAQEVQDQKEYDDQVKAHKVEKARRAQESDAKLSEKKRKVAKVAELTLQKKHTNDELDAVKQYSKDLQPACVDGDSSFADRKASRAKEIKALKDAQVLLQDAFKKKSAAFLEIGNQGDKKQITLHQDPVKLPEQGYEGEGVRHENMKSITKDWGSEYGPTTVAPYHSGSQNTAVLALPAVMALLAMRM